MRITEFGNPILRKVTTHLELDEIKNPETTKLISDMKELLRTKKLGVGLAAPQIGKNISLAIIDILPLKHRSKINKFELVIINPLITQTFGRRVQMHEGCISSGSAKSGLFAKVPRYKKIKLRYFDEKGRRHHKIFEGLPAHVIQHEVDHLNGVLFVDKVKDTKSYISYREYMKTLKDESKK